MQNVATKHLSMTLLAALLLMPLLAASAQAQDADKEPAVTSEERARAEAIAAQPLTRLVAHLAMRLPDGWYVESVSRGKVTPAGRPEGNGDQIVLLQKLKGAADEQQTSFAKVVISLMNDAAAYAKAPAGDAGDAAKPAAGAERIGEWNGQAVLTSCENADGWKEFRRDTTLAMKAAEKPLAATLRGSKVFIGPLRFTQKEMPADDASSPSSHRLINVGNVLDIASSKRLEVSIAGNHPLHKQLPPSLTNCLAVATSNSVSPVAIIPFDKLQPPPAEADVAGAGVAGAVEEKPAVRRVHCLVSGRVQGVGFRAWTVQQAKQIGQLTGWVMNLPDGRVSAMIEGPTAHVDELIKRQIGRAHV